MNSSYASNPVSIPNSVQDSNQYQVGTNMLDSDTSSGDSPIQDSNVRFLSTSEETSTIVSCHNCHGSRPRFAVLKDGDVDGLRKGVKVKFQGKSATVDAVGYELVYGKSSTEPTLAKTHQIKVKLVCGFNIKNIIKHGFPLR